jgi:hypothetical protein
VALSSPRFSPIPPPRSSAASDFPPENQAAALSLREGTHAESSVKLESSGRDAEAPDRRATRKIMVNEILTDFAKSIRINHLCKVARVQPCGFHSPG